MDNYNSTQPTIPGNEPPQPTPQPTPQPMAQPTPQPMAQPAMPQSMPQPAPVAESPQPPAPKQHKALFAVIISLIIIAITAIAVILLILPKNKEITTETVLSYCQEHNMEVSTDSLDPEIEAVYCYPENDTKFKIIFTYSNSPISDNQSLNSTGMFTSIINYGTTIEDTEEYQKYYLNLTGSGTDINNIYLIISKNSAIIVTGENESTIRKTLIDLGYPNRNWPSSEQTSTDSSSSLMAINQRNIQRRNDMSRVSTALILYETNNLSQLPTSPSLYVPSTSSGSFTDGTSFGTSAAKDFIRRYMNYETDSTTNEFADPDGTFYSMYITESFADTDYLTTDLGNNSLSYLAPTSDSGYTIGGSSPFSQHIIYVIPGAMCSSNQPNSIIKATTQRDFAVMYMLEGDKNEIYCVDNQ